jgi:hypothetical protein
MVTNSKMRGEASAPMYKLESPATAVSRQFAPNLLDVKDLAIVTLRLEDFAQHLAYYALNGPTQRRDQHCKSFFSSKR